MKNTTEKFHKKIYHIPDRAETEAETMRQSRGRGRKVETEARPCEVEARPSQLKTASRPPRAEADTSRTPSLVIRRIHKAILTELSRFQIAEAEYDNNKQICSRISPFFLQSVSWVMKI